MSVPPATVGVDDGDDALVLGVRRDQLGRRVGIAGVVAAIDRIEIGDHPGNRHVSVMIFFRREAEDGVIATLELARPTDARTAEQLGECKELFLDDQLAGCRHRAHRNPRVCRTNYARARRRQRTAFPVADLALEHLARGVQRRGIVHQFGKVDAALFQESFHARGAGREPIVVVDIAQQLGDFAARCQLGNPGGVLQLARVKSAHSAVSYQPLAGDFPGFPDDVFVCHA